MENYQKRNKVTVKKKESIKNDIYIIKSIFLIILAIVGNHVAGTLGSDTIKIINNNIYIQYMLIYCIIYFTMDLNTDILDNNHMASPMKNALISLLLLILLINICQFWYQISFH